MSIKDLCRLCVSRCQDFKILFDENGQENDAYILMVKYFDSSYFKVELAKQLSVICYQCWQHIDDFNIFQQSVLKAQQKLLQNDQAAIKVHIKSEPQHEMDINRKIETPVVADTSGEKSLLNINAAYEKSQENLMGKDLNNSPFQHDNNHTPNVHNEEGKVFSEPKLEIMDVSASGDEMDMPNSTIKMEKADVPNNNIDRADVIIPDNYNNALAEDDSMSEMDESEENFSWDEEASTTYSEDEATKSSVREEPTSSNALKKQKEIERLQESDEIIARWKPFLACLMCSEPCETLTILQQHFRQAHPQADCYVLCCRRRMKDRFKIEQHMKHHINPDSYECDKCGERFKYRSSLGSHKRKHNFVKNRSSSQADRKTAKTSDEFIAKWKPYLDCALCNVKESTYTRLQEHFSEEHPLDQTHISCCGQKLSGRHRVQEHIKVHMDPNAFKCDICFKCFKMRWHLKTHIRRIHPDVQDKEKQTNERKTQYLSKLGNQHDELIAQWKPLLECVVCNESFANFSLLEKHFRPSHPNDELYISCCQLKLNRPYRVLEHARYHVNPNAFKCVECGKSYKNKHTLGNHMKTHHPEIKL